MGIGKTTLYALAALIFAILVYYLWKKCRAPANDHK